MSPSDMLIYCMDIVGNAIIGSLNLFYRLWATFDIGYFLYPLMALSAIMAFFVKPLIGHANDIRGAYESKKARESRLKSKTAQPNNSTN